MEELPAVVKHAGHGYAIALPGVATSGSVAAWVETAQARVAGATGVPPCSQRLLSKAWKGGLSSTSFRSVAKAAAKIAKCRKKAAKGGGVAPPLALMLFEEERASDVKIALGHATPLQLFEEDVRAAVRRTETQEESIRKAGHARRARRRVVVDPNALSSPPASPSAAASANSDFVNMVEDNEARARVIAHGIRARAAWRKRAQELHNSLGDAWSQWRCDACTYATNSATLEQCIVCKASRILHAGSGMPSAYGGDGGSGGERDSGRGNIAGFEPLLGLIGLQGFHGHEETATQCLARVGSSFQNHARHRSHRYARHSPHRQTISWLPDFLEMAPGATLVQSEGRCAHDGQTRFAFAVPCDARVWIAVSPAVMQEGGPPEWLLRDFERIDDEVVLLSSSQFGISSPDKNELDHLGLFVVKKGLVRGDVFQAKEMHTRSASGVGEGERGEEEGEEEDVGSLRVAIPALVLVSTEESYVAWRRARGSEST
jgi:rubrerythrin